MISIESFIAGFAYGGTTVLVGQPMETLKTLTQVQSTAASATAKGASSSSSLIQTAKNLYSTAGIRGFYRGGMPLLLGGGLMRSAQFGVYQSVVPTLEKRYGKTDPKNYWLGCINPHVVAAGWAGGIGRGLVEGPFEMVKVMKQVVAGWHFRDVFQGFGATLFRNSFLFAGFVIYLDIFKQKIEQKHELTVTPFVKAGICANLAWLTIWPLDVVKTRRQSGKYNGKSLVWLLGDAFRSGHMYKGLSVGMLRSFIANGASMEVYTIVERELKRRAQ
mmetsp:Transcript_12357/g.26294  ORF Transcript_12357/g.26294 Transcript_12357/m.26294 type:complete len:275 (+) Transcript_12357:115-939(+)|eukprot:CAMPEP_0183739106 /NCGR_PEP_ID=MMETSP0737-20130205/56224_1 /TAXON_ID=385413 /ORGANISM="Thalassiosira miniscula, Strain CCMP1093" /LENGTH=274 /DNA_ID=CAMNT_0025973815 /DNA_START=61 /DNA_END=885 /DNA_ORIENTATION=-